MKHKNRKKVYLKTGYYTYGGSAVKNPPVMQEMQEMPV